jgi:FkbM family methyltransferase
LASAYLAFSDGRLTVVEIGATDPAWADQVLAERPQTRLHRLGGIPALDDALPGLDVRHVNYLRIADGAAALPILLGARRALGHARIDIIEIAGGVTIATPTALLQPFDFLLLPPSAKLNDLLLTPFGGIGGTTALFALHRRFAGAIVGGNREPDLGALLTARQLPRRGIIHVGAHTGEEVASYLALGFERLLLIEADPTLAAALAERFRAEPRVEIASCAVADFDGTIELRVTSSTRSTSILPLKRHADIFPGISETAQVRVPARALDSLLAERRHADDAFNIMTLDIQGAELLALGGADRLLQHLDGLMVEVNFDEMYQGCAQIEDIDDHLAGRGFARVMTMSPYQSSFGDAFYLRESRSS